MNRDNQEQKKNAINSGTYNPYKSFLNDIGRANNRLIPEYYNNLIIILYKNLYFCTKLL